MRRVSCLPFGWAATGVESKDSSSSRSCVEPPNVLLSAPMFETPNDAEHKSNCSAGLAADRAADRAAYRAAGLADGLGEACA